MVEIRLKGIPAADGLRIGRVFHYEPQELVIPERDPGSFDEEIHQFKQAVEQAVLELGGLKSDIEKRAGAKTAAIFDAHIAMAKDPMLLEAVISGLKSGLPVEKSLQAASKEIAEMLSGLKDPLFSSRAVDVQDVSNRILRILLGKSDASLEALREPSIIAAIDLTPSDTASLRPELTLGFCTAVGGLTSHTAILARTLGIPAVVGLGSAAIHRIPGGAVAALDGFEGEVIIDPDEATRLEFERRLAAQQQRMSRLEGSASRPAHTADGKRVEVGANIGEIESAREAVRFGAEGVGLLRTEFLYLNEPEPPGEELQLRAYRQIFEALGDRPIIVRTLDIGGDKPPSYLEFEKELNPFLGWRAIRICLDRPDLFRTQLRAILRAAAGLRVLVMFPMIASMEELRQSKAALKEAALELEREGLVHESNPAVGIMVETPAAAVLSDLLAAECDFLSIGTNDLTQYTLAVDRTNERIAGLFQPLHPAVLRLIRQTIDAAHARGIWCGMCGELAGMQKAIPILLGMGLDEFSMAPRLIPAAKALIATLSRTEAEGLASQALSLPSSSEIELLMGEWLVGRDGAA